MSSPENEAFAATSPGLEEVARPIHSEVGGWDAESLAAKDVPD